MKKLYTIALALLFSGFTGNLLIGMEQLNNITIPVATVISAYPIANDPLHEIISYDQNIEFETKYCSKIYIGFPKNVATRREQAYMAQSAIATIKAYDEKLPQALDKHSGKAALGCLIFGATLGAAITYACMRNKK